MQLEFVMGTALEAPALCDWSSHLGAYKEQTTGFVLHLQSYTISFARFARSLLITITSFTSTAVDRNMQGHGGFCEAAAEGVIRHFRCDDDSSFPNLI